jgi:hypothetical protein
MAIFQCRRCKSVWNHVTVPEVVVERVHEILEQGDFIPVARVLDLIS